MMFFRDDVMTLFGIRDYEGFNFSVRARGGAMVSLNPCAAFRSATESESCPFAMTERDRIAKLIIVCIQRMVICFERLVNLAADTLWSTRMWELRTSG